MMKNLRQRLERLLPFLSVPALEGPSPGDPSSAPETLGPDLRLSNRDLQGNRLTELSLARASFYRVSLDNAVLSRVDLSSSQLAHCRLGSAQLERCALDASEWAIVDAEGATLSNCNLRVVRWSGVSLRDGALEVVDLSGARLSLCDFFGARLKQVSASEAVLRGVDFSHAHLEDVDFTGADLRGASLANAVVQAVKLDGALVNDLDLRGVRGLSEAERAELRGRGAIMRPGWLEGLLARGLGWMRPGLASERREKVARWGSLGAKVLGGLALIGLGYVGYLALPSAPQTADDAGDAPAKAVSEKPRGTAGGTAAGSPAPVGEPEAKEQALHAATQEEIEKTKAGLAALRAAIKAAYEVTAKNGVARYPTLDDLANNQFDRDGAGPAEERVPVMESGLPNNFLTAGEGIAPYCNEVPTQDTLTGDDVDWHYCEDTGRVLPCGGYTTAATLQW